MWARKSEDEIREHLDRQEAKRKSLLRPALFAAALAAGAMIVYSLGYRGGWLRGGLVLTSRPSGFNTRTLLFAVFIFAVFFPVALYNQRRRGTRPYAADDSLLCRECKQPSHANPSGVCACGGRLEPFAFFNWAEG